MKKIVNNLLPMLILLQTVIFSTDAQIDNKKLVGAWETGTDVKMTRIVTDEFSSVAVYKINEFVSTAGGRWKVDGKNLVETFEYSTASPDLVGKEISTPVELNKDKLVLTVNDKKQSWSRVDDGTPGKLAGAWLITGRMRDGQMSKMTPGARRTMKILSGTRFQWIAYNVDTKEFSGTGGGTYTTENGKYTENILFFSRDNSRVGASLQFDFSLENGDWRHKGFSSKGDPIDEVWTKREKTGL